MSKKRYIFNAETLKYELQVVKSRSWLYVLGVIICGVGMALGFIWWWNVRLEMDGLKTYVLRRKNDHWSSKVEVLNSRLDIHEAALEGLERRDEDIYRPLFGLASLPKEFREEGFKGVNRYSDLQDLPMDNPLKHTAIRLDILTKKAYVQSNSYKDVNQLSIKAGNMASCIPAIPPMSTDRSKYRLSSPFGVRYDPLNGTRKRHMGIDFSCKPGNKIYATGDGTVSLVKHEFKRSFGNRVEIDHGFGYMTRYAHMSAIFVHEGQKVHRGTLIGLSGNSGRSTGPHLHYEVWLRGNAVNPMSYMDLDMSVEDYQSMIEGAGHGRKF